MACKRTNELVEPLPQRNEHPPGPTARPRPETAYPHGGGQRQGGAAISASRPPDTASVRYRQWTTHLIVELDVSWHEALSLVVERWPNIPGGVLSTSTAIRLVIPCRSTVQLPAHENCIVFRRQVTCLRVAAAVQCSPLADTSQPARAPSKHALLVCRRTLRAPVYVQTQFWPQYCWRPLAGRSCRLPQFSSFVSVWWSGHRSITTVTRCTEDTDPPVFMTPSWVGLLR